MDLNDYILIFFLIGFNILFYKYFLLILNKNSPNLLVDDQLEKPQAFHELQVPISGGIGIFFSFLILCLYLFLTKQFIYKNIWTADTLHLKK